MAAACRDVVAPGHRSAVPLATLAAVPLNAFSNASRLFDPTYFFSPVGGPYTASVGALGVTGAIALLAALAAARAPFRFRPAWLAPPIAVAISVGALVALRYVAGGITLPATEVPLSLWVGWQVALALGTTALLVAAGVAARGVFGPTRGLRRCCRWGWPCSLPPWARCCGVSVATGLTGICSCGVPPRSPQRMRGAADGA